MWQILNWSYHSEFVIVLLGGQTNGSYLKQEATFQNKNAEGTPKTILYNKSNIVTLIVFKVKLNSSDY